MSTALTPSAEIPQYALATFMVRAIRSANDSTDPRRWWLVDKLRTHLGPCSNAVANLTHDVREARAYAAASMVEWGIHNKALYHELFARSAKEDWANAWRILYGG